MFRELSNFEEGTECDIGHYYKDEDTMRLVNAMANIIGLRPIILIATHVFP
jgi:hypothetical protein